MYQNGIETEKISLPHTSEYFTCVFIAMLCDNWTKKIFVSACIFSDITNVWGENISKTMKEIYVFNS
jgi:hypothetical protein